MTGTEYGDIIFARVSKSTLFKYPIVPIILNDLPSFKVAFSKISRNNSDAGWLHS